MQIYPRHACGEYLETVDKFGFTVDSVPQLEDISQILQVRGLKVDHAGSDPSCVALQAYGDAVQPAFTPVLTQAARLPASCFAATMSCIQAELLHLEDCQHLLRTPNALIGVPVCRVVRHEDQGLTAWSEHCSALRATGGDGVGGAPGGGAAAPAGLFERPVLPDLPQHAVHAAPRAADVHAGAGPGPRAAWCGPDFHGLITSQRQRSDQPQLQCSVDARHADSSSGTTADYALPSPSCLTIAARHELALSYAEIYTVHVLTWLGTAWSSGTQQLVGAEQQGCCDATAAPDPLNVGAQSERYAALLVLWSPRC